MRGEKVCREVRKNVGRMSGECGSWGCKEVLGEVWGLWGSISD